MIKKIESKVQKDKKDRRNQFILGGILVVVLLFSVFGIAFQYLSGSSSTGGTQQVTYNNVTFQLSQNGYYVLQSGSASFYFSVNPQNASATTDNVTFNKTLADYGNQVLYVSSPYDYNSYNELYTDLSNYTIRVQGACAENETCVDNTLPLKNCSDNLIIIKLAPTDRIYQKENCIYIEGNQNDLLSLTDEFLLHLLRIN